jgi:dihydrolipoamide dehydrogenase
MDTDVAVVGGGPGGYTAAIRAAQRGFDVTLVERADPGGVCLNHGCIPSKALVEAADLVHEAGSAERMGVHADPEVDVPQLASWTDRLVARLSRGVEHLCDRAGVEVLAGEGRFADRSTLEVTGGGETVERSFEYAVVATGSAPVELPGFDFAEAPVWSSRDALRRESLPDRLAVIGAGYIGLELATALAKLGVDVVVLEAETRALPGFDADLADPVEDRLGEVGVDLRVERAAEGWHRDGDGIAVVAAASDGEETHAADAVLVAVGRRPTPPELDALGIETDNGFVPTDEQGQTPAEGVYAVGDVAGEPMLAHAAAMEGKVAVAAICGEPATTRAVPAAVFTDPEVATVGHTPDSARAAGLDPAVGEFPLRASGRALVEREREGFVRVVAAGGQVVGGQVVGPGAADLVGELSLAVETAASTAALARAVHVHPTLSEAVGEAAEAVAGESIHAP